MKESVKMNEEGELKVVDTSMSTCNDLLSLWFGLSYASFLVLPRVLMDCMPKEWKQKMALLLFEYDESYPNQPDFGTRVQITQHGKLIKTPDWIINYRYPDYRTIDLLRR